MTEDLAEALKQCRIEKDEYLDLARRLKADYVNLEREEQARRGTAIQFGKHDVLSDLIDLADTFELAVNNKAAWEAVPLNWRQGVEHIYSRLREVIERHGLVEKGQVGEKFDPVYHESVGMVPVGTAEQDGLVTELVTKGYQLGQIVLRPAKVRVGFYQVKE